MVGWSTMERVAHPYRSMPRAARARPSDRRLGFATFAFGFLCVLAGASIAGPAGMLFATIAGVALLIVPAPAGACARAAEDDDDPG
jgi:hypothetical protein